MRWTIGGEREQAGLVLLRDGWQVALFADATECQQVCDRLQRHDEVINRQISLQHSERVQLDCRDELLKVGEQMGLIPKALGPIDRFKQLAESVRLTTAERQAFVDNGTIHGGRAGDN